MVLLGVKQWLISVNRRRCDTRTPAPEIHKGNSSTMSARRVARASSEIAACPNAESTCTLDAGGAFDLWASRPDHRKIGEAMWIATAERMREIDRLAVEKYSISIDDLVQRAGKAVFLAAMQVLAGRNSVLVVCGKGNNGADGLVAAALLARAGCAVELVLACDPDELGARNLDLLQACSEAIVTPLQGPISELSLKPQYDLIIDAILGTGAYGAPTGRVVQAIEMIRSIDAEVLSVDIPSGIDANSGAAAGLNVVANNTITLGLPKRFLFLGEGAQACGSWSLDELGFPAELLFEPTGTWLIEQRDVARLMPIRTKRAHKGSAGKLLIVAGSDAMPGAAVLAAMSAMRAGAGLVTVASSPEVCRAVSHHVPEAILLPLQPADAAGQILDAQSRVDAAVFGPGLGLHDSVGNLLAEVWREWRLPSVIDADALTWVSRGVSLPKCCVLTPHPSEMARLLETATAQIESDRFLWARTCTENFGQTSLLKGASTVVAEPGGILRVNPTGNPGMATAGMGDVLSGVIGALLAAGLSPSDAATVGAYWHGAAGELCAKEIGAIGYLASDVASRLPQARAKIRSSCENR